MPDIPPTGASPSELIELERRIAVRGLQLRSHSVSSGGKRQGAKALTDYEETQIRAALLALANALAGRDAADG